MSKAASKLKTLTSSTGASRRGHIRYKPDPGTCAYIDPKPDREPFEKVLVALISDESYSGCSIVTYAQDSLKVGETVRIKVGEIGPLRAQIRWLEKLDGGRLHRLGLQFLE